MEDSLPNKVDRFMTVLMANQRRLYQYVHDTYVATPASRGKDTASPPADNKNKRVPNSDAESDSTAKRSRRANPRRPSKKTAVQ